MLSGLAPAGVVALIAQALEDEPSVDPQDGGVVRSGSRRSR
jgi:hypothetical protein